MKTLDFSFLRQQILGVDASLRTPFGVRPQVYCDYTASGRSLRFVEEYLQRVQCHYANTHTEDDMTGRYTTRLLHQAEQVIKAAVNAGENGRIIACGTGSTGAIDKMQQLIGVALAPATRQALLGFLDGCLGHDGRCRFEEFQDRHQPVVFVGPYEHHSNEVTWREGLATVVEVELDASGAINLAHLESLLDDARYQGRLRIGSFSAASNVTGLRTPVHDIARLLHRHGALAFFDYAACAPYVEIDMNPPSGAGDGDGSLDAIFISPHKFLGGPGSSGILVFNERLYNRELAPSVGGGGTVDYVGLDDHDFVRDIEEREKAGTPGILQTMKAALAFAVKTAVGVEAIERRESALTRKAFDQWAGSNIEILGHRDPDLRVSIISFNVKDPRGAYLHPKFVTTLLNDLFGIQSRAGCSCAGPYGHRLLNIDRELSHEYRHWIARGYSGIKPGWCRLGFHYVMDDAEAQYVIDAVDFVGEFGHLFLSLYEFDLATGAWTHRDFRDTPPEFSLAEALAAGDATDEPLSAEQRAKIYHRCLQEARALARQLNRTSAPESARLEGKLGELQFFSM
ncbi:MAG: aminotransferase class V-fold PLP-dependent enzyme [Gammaproteobacteria bacterium]|nr:aminotransferase class V-fold PLP-dependent enzyme [Gammaproteobacteria bacterium]